MSYPPQVGASRPATRQSRWGFFVFPNRRPGLSVQSSPDGLTPTPVSLSIGRVKFSFDLILILDRLCPRLGTEANEGQRPRLRVGNWTEDLHTSRKFQWCP